ncbi:hypothetical protein Sjap_017947 [Stephania japonica]|uniref:Uncharacterized protein n=1 Tax=Stephania japonica TaxID=461633 RepID=A0AAP0I753_9MAGN
MECTEEVFLAKIIHGDGAKVIKVGEVNATTVEDEDDIAKFKDYKPSQPGDSKEAKVPLSKIKGAGYDGTIVRGEILKASSGKGASAPPTSKPKDKATEAGINYTEP